MKYELNYQTSSGVEVLRISKKNKVKSIKRLSDGEVFSKGDVIEQGEITWFNVNNAFGDSYAYVKSTVYGVKVDNLIKINK